MSFIDARTPPALGEFAKFQAGVSEHRVSRLKPVGLLGQGIFCINHLTIGIHGIGQFTPQWQQLVLYRELIEPIGEPEDRQDQKQKQKWYDNQVNSERRK